MQNQQAPATLEVAVRIERPENAAATSECRVISARLLGLNGARLISARLPYAAVKDHFKAGDLDFVTVRAEVRGGALHLKERLPDGDFFTHPDLDKVLPHLSQKGH